MENYQCIYFINFSKTQNFIVLNKHSLFYRGKDFDRIQKNMTKIFNRLKKIFTKKITFVLLIILIIFGYFARSEEHTSELQSH